MKHLCEHAPGLASQILVWPDKNLSETNTLAYCVPPSETKKKNV